MLGVISKRVKREALLGVPEARLGNTKIRKGRSPLFKIPIVCLEFKVCHIEVCHMVSSANKGDCFAVGAPSWVVVIAGVVGDVGQFQIGRAHV